MPINLITYTSESFLAEYVNTKNNQRYILPEILGYFPTENDAKLKALDELLKASVISASQYMSLRRHILNPQSNDYYIELSKKGVLSRLNKN